MSTARDIHGPWLSRESMDKLPDVHREFDLNRDPTIAEQVRDLEKTESQRRGEQSGGQGIRRSRYRRGEPKPALNLHPPANTQRPNGPWLAIQRDKAIAQTLPARSSPQPQRSRVRQLEPDR